MVLERWMSGLSHTPGKRARGQTLRGFESRLLRQKLQIKRAHRARFFHLRHHNATHGGKK